MALQRPARLGEQVTLGHALLTVQDPQFLDGYTAGFRQYCRHEVARPLSDARIAQMLADQHRTASDAVMWHAGYVLGWITAAQGLPRMQHLCKPRRLAKPHPTTVTPIGEQTGSGPALGGDLPSQKSFVARDR